MDNVRAPMRGSKRTLAVVAALIAGLLAAGPAAAATGDLGTEDFSYAPLTGSPTQTKPESKLWFADGDWWADLYAPSTAAHRIHRLDPATDSWVDTGTTLDTRRNANSDVLWHAASRKLYVASHVFTEHGVPASPGESARLYRYSYDPGTRQYTLDQGFPVVINAARTESLVIDMDSTGRLWATWQQDAQIYVNHSSGDDASWGTPYIVNVNFVNEANDDVAALVPFGGDKIGILFSSQFFPNGWYHLLVHRDGAGDAPADWHLEQVPGILNANDHINLKADRAGRLFAAVKRHSIDKTVPRVQLLRRDPDGRWTSGTFGTTGDGHTRPIVLLEDPGSGAHVFATCPRTPGTDAGSGGDICQKTTSTEALGFEPGNGTPVLQDASSPELNDVTSTKQPVNSATGLVLLANNPADGIDTYWHRRLELSTPAPPAVSAGFAAARDAADPLTARFIDTSTGAPTSWLWDFGDGTTSTARHATHRYAAAGEYTVRLTAASATSTHTTTVTQQIPVPVAARPSAPAPAPAPAPRPPQAAVNRATGYRPTLSLNRRYLKRGRVRLYGAVSRRVSGERILLQRQAGKRWQTVARARLLALSRGRSRFAFVLRRWSRTSKVRVLLPEKGLRFRAVSRSMTVARRR
jgi:PKD repeat protein